MSVLEGPRYGGCRLSHLICSYEYPNSKGFELRGIAHKGFVSLIFLVAQEDLLQIRIHRRMKGILN